MELKNFVDFTYSLVNMDEVKKGSFVLPKEIIFELSEEEHIQIHRKIKEEKGDITNQSLKESFDIEILGVLLKFKLNNE
jgi:hypothetical protein